MSGRFLLRISPMEAPLRIRAAPSIWIGVISSFSTIFLACDRLLVVLPENHPLAGCVRFPIPALCDGPFMLLEKGEKSEISEIFELHKIVPNVHFTTLDDYVSSAALMRLGIAVSVPGTRAAIWYAVPAVRPVKRPEICQAP